MSFIIIIIIACFSVANRDSVLSVFHIFQSDQQFPEKSKTFVRNFNALCHIVGYIFRSNDITEKVVYNCFITVSAVLESFDFSFLKIKRPQKILKSFELHLQVFNIFSCML